MFSFEPLSDQNIFFVAIQTNIIYRRKILTFKEVSLIRNKLSVKLTDTLRTLMILLFGR